MATESFAEMRDKALDPTTDEHARLVAIQGLAGLRSREAAEVLLELGGRNNDSDAVLRAAGRALGDLAAEGLVSQWDVRDLADPADDGFFE